MYKYKLKYMYILELFFHWYKSYGTILDTRLFRSIISSDVIAIFRSYVSNIVKSFLFPSFISHRCNYTISQISKRTVIEIR